jgi:hypothetical protein
MSDSTRRTVLAGMGAVTLNGLALSLQACSGGDEGNAPPAPPPGTFDTIPPSVASVFPGNGAETSDLGIRILVTFSEPIDAGSVTPASFRLLRAADGSPVTGTVSVSGATATFSPSTALASGTSYQARVSTAVKDVAGNAVAAEFTSVFSTAATAVLPTLGAHGLAYKTQGPAGRTVTVDLGTTAAIRSTILVCIGRGVISSHKAPVDNKGNSYSQVDTTHPYLPRWPNSGTALYASALSTGGATHVVTVDNTSTITDEVTVAVVEVQNGGTLQAAWNQVQSGDPLQSLAVVTTGPATLVAFWWGDADGSVPHTAVPGGGFTRIDAALPAGSLVQCAVAIREVQSAGTYSVNWTATPQQGAQLWLVAVQ